MKCKLQRNKKYVVWGNPCLYLRSIVWSPFLKVPLYFAPWGKEELIMAINLFLGKRKHYNTNYISRLKETIAKKFNSPNIFLFSSGREAIKFALKLVELKQDEEVILPSLACTSILEPILDFKAIPVFVDVDKNLNIDPEDVEVKISPKTKVIIAPHLYGNPAQIEKLSEIAERRKIFLIDDAAQAPGINYKNRYLGTWGDFGILSFGFGKPIFGIGGGALIVNNQNFLFSAKNEYKKLLPEDESEASKRAWKILMKGRFRTITFMPFLLKRCLSFKQKESYTFLRQSFNIIPRKISNISSFYALKAVYNLDYCINNCLHNTKALLLKFKSLKGIKYIYSGQKDSFFWRLPIFIENNIDGNAFLCFLYRHGIEAEPIYTPLHFQVSDSVKLPKTEYLYDKTFLLSLCSKMTPDLINFVFKVLEKYENYSFKL